MNFLPIIPILGSLSILDQHGETHCQQSRTISGIVKNSQGETIIGRISLKKVPIAGRLQM